MQNLNKKIQTGLESSAILTHVRNRQWATTLLKTRQIYKLIKRKTMHRLCLRVPEKCLESVVKRYNGRSLTVGISCYFFLPPLSLRAKWMTAPLAIL